MGRSNEKKKGEIFWGGAKKKKNFFFLPPRGKKKFFSFFHLTPDQVLQETPVICPSKMPGFAELKFKTILIYTVAPTYNLALHLKW